MTVLKALKRTIRKYIGGGLSNMNDPGIPKAQVEVYLRDSEGGTFYVATLHEGILHLLSNEGYRLGVYESPDGDAWSERYGIVMYRGENSLGVRLQAPMLNRPDELNRVEFDPNYSGPRPAMQPQMEPFLVAAPIDPDNPPVPMTVAELYKETEVTIDGQ